MLREISMDEVSDGKRYGSSDLVKVGCQDCAGCSACCRGMSEVFLDPWDIREMTRGLGKTFEEMLDQQVTLGVADGLILPHLMLTGEAEQCVFLNKQGRCDIHGFRPGICRLFPLGRIYEEDSFSYFIQIHECPRENKTKVKVKKWLGIPELNRYEAFIMDWHCLQKEVQELLLQPERQEQRREAALLILRLFYQLPYSGQEDFYLQYARRAARVREQWKLK